MNTSKLEIDSALVDVRRAYRLLHDYQRAALDAAKYVGIKTGFEYAGGYPLFSNCSPRNGKGILESWSWDWLNLFFYDFHFTRKVDGERTLNLSMWLFSDTGYYVSDDPAPVETDVSTFAPVEKSSTKIGFLMYLNWEPEFDELFYKNRDAIRTFLETNGELPAGLRNAGAFGKCYDFAQLSDEESAGQVIAELINLAAMHGYLLEPAVKPV